MPEQIFLPAPVGDGFSGDVHAISALTPNLFGANQATGWCGRDAKNNAEVNIFQRYDISAILLGSRINGAGIRFTTNAAADGAGSMKLGALRDDSPSDPAIPVDRIWHTYGFHYSILDPLDRTVYFNSHYYPPPQFQVSWLPHATKNNQLNIQANRIMLNTFLANNTFTWTAGTPGAGTTVIIGNGVTGVTQDDFTNLAIFVVVLRNNLNQRIIGFTWDSQNVGNGINRLRMYMSSTGTDANKPALIVDWDENPPDITSTAVTVGTEQLLYVYDANGTIWTLGDQAAGTADDVVWSFDTAVPAGMTIDSDTGLIEWPVAVGQAGNHAITIRFTNAAPLSDTQSFTILVPPVFLSGDASVIRGDVLGHQVTVTNFVGCTFSLLSAPAGMTINATTGLLTWPTGGIALGPYSVNIQATYELGNASDQFITVTVLPPLPVAPPDEQTIINAALVLLGEMTVVLREGTTTARLMQDRFGEVRDALLREHPWNFAIRRVLLPENAVPPVYGRDHAYPLPGDFIRLLEVEDINYVGHEIEGNQIVTDLGAPLKVTYVSRVTNPADFDRKFWHCLEAALAVDVCEVITGSSGKLEYVLGVLRDRLEAARTADGQENPPAKIATVWQRARGREH